MENRESAKISTGIGGFDEILQGGLLPGRAYLVRGEAGTGKTILGMHFLTAGVAADESVLFISLQESEHQLRANAKNISRDVSGVQFLDLSPPSEFFKQTESYDLFSPAEVEREPITKNILQTIERLKPTRVFIDPVTQFRYLAVDSFHFRKQVISFLRFLAELRVTVLLTSEASREVPDDDLKVIADGIVLLEHKDGARFITAEKMRGADFADGRHTLRISGAGMAVFPRLQSGTFKKEFTPELFPSGVPEIDEILNGGLERGTVTLISGPSGVGKTTFGVQFVREAAGRGERAVVFSFEENVASMLQRFEAINIPAKFMMQRGTLAIEKIEPQRSSADEFLSQVRHEVEAMNARVVMIDSLEGFGIGLDQRDLIRNLYALCDYFRNRGVSLFLVTETSNIIESLTISDIGVSYLADNIVFLRYLEIRGEMRKAIGVLKKRLSDFEKTLREFEITRYGIKVGKPLRDLRGILRGMPEFILSPEPQ